MKKTLLILVAAMLTTMFASAQITDTIVSMTPSNRNVVLEEYTGVNCQYCPDGHRRANELKAAYPDRVSVINIHQGSFANNTYTTQFGNALANQTGLEGYPSGTVNRHVFSGSSTALNRGEWAARAQQIMAMSSPVNIAAEGTLDWATRTVTIRVQLYYTASQNVTSNALNVAILQDNVLGSQTGMAGNPDQVVGNQYNHMHMLRHLITGQWGETIEDIAQGTLVEKNYTYEIPAQLGSPAINAALENLTFVAFVCEGHQEILTGTEVPITHVNVSGINANMNSLKVNVGTNCDNTVSGYFVFKNVSGDNATTLDYTYKVNGVETSATWTGSVASMQEGTVNIPAMEINLNQNNTIKAKITALNGTPVTSSERSTTVKKSLYTVGGNMTFILKTDNYGSETTFKFFAPDGSVVLSGGPFTNSSTIHEFAFLPPTTGCYRLEVYDAFGDGINAGYGTGYFQLNDAEGNQIFKDNGKFGAQATYMLDVTTPAGIEEVALESTTVYPNPATDVLNINTNENVQRVEIFNMQGQLVKAENGTVNHISVKDLANGLYTVKLTTDNGTSMHKIIKK
ncbi:MAG: Omp28-related outer membrane protein [Bacteroidales bacterium]|nr:Omp28-related outer membrane protein [Bacteroidales bacterium]